MIANIIEAVEVEFSFGAKKILAGITLTVPRGCICALLGPNGAGKTTFIKNMVNILARSRGTLNVLGQDSKKLSPAEFEQIGYVSENQELPEWMKIGYFLNFCSKMYPSWDKEWCQELLDLMKLPTDQSIRSLSRGMKMKVALISSLAYKPQLLILDEPFSGLDPLIRDEVLQSIVNLAASQKLTVFMSSHDLAEVERISDRIAFIKEGKVIAELPLDQLLTEYRSVALSSSVEIPRPSSLPPAWASLRISGRHATAVLNSSNEEELKRLVSENMPACSITSIDGLTLKEIYRVFME